MIGDEGPVRARGGVRDSVAEAPEEPMHRLAIATARARRPTGTRRAATAVVVAILGGWSCSSFTGRAPDASAPLDAPGDRPDGPSSERADSPDGASDATGDVGLAFVCGVRVGACDPVGGAGCAGGAACVMGAWPSTTPRCAPPGAAGYLEACDASSGQFCERGYQCVRRRCIALCCATGGDDDCAARIGAGSRCAIRTELGSIAACTVPGDCDYVSQRGCASGSACFATSALGEGRCVTPGTTPAGRSCTSYAECSEGATCVGAPVGACRMMCNPRGSNSCGLGEHCTEFSDRPADYGWCGT